MIRGRNLAEWLPTTIDPVRRAIVEEAMMDDGIIENPLGSNRSGRIDAYCTACGSPLGSYWCAAAVTTWMKNAGAMTPPTEAGACRRWLAWGESLGLRLPPGQDPQPGDLVLYGVGRDPYHIGVVIRVHAETGGARLLLSKEGNTSIGGASVVRNGVAVVTKAIDEPHVLCYLSPKAVAP